MTHNGHRACAAAAMVRMLVQQHPTKKHTEIVTGVSWSGANELVTARRVLDVLASAPIEDGGRRIAVLGDMLELGDHSRDLHAGLADAVSAAAIDRLYLAGPEIRVLADALPNDMHCEYEASADDLTGALVASPQPGDVIMVKSSNGIGFSRIVKAFLEKYPQAAG